MSLLGLSNPLHRRNHLVGTSRNLQFHEHSERSQDLEWVRGERQKTSNRERRKSSWLAWFTHSVVAFQSTGFSIVRRIVEIPRS